MRYLGGKARFGEEIARIVRSKCSQNQTIWEPFCGACWVTQYFTPAFQVKCSDIYEPLIALHCAVQESNWEPPDFVSEKEYNLTRERWLNGECSPFIGFVGFACSWGGKWFAGYSRGDDRNFCFEAKESLLEKHQYLKHVIFSHENYRNRHPHGYVIYCDPPYRGTTGYSSEIFDTRMFWQVVRKWSKENTVIVSEYAAPLDFKIIWEAEHYSIRGTDSKITTERLFTLK